MKRPLSGEVERQVNCGRNEKDNGYDSLSRQAIRFQILASAALYRQAEVALFIKKKSAWLVISTLIAFGVLCFRAYNHARPSSRDIASEAASTYDFEALSQLILNPSAPVTSIDSLIEKLPTVLRSNFTLMYESRSLQKSDPNNPRVIMSTLDGRLTCAYGAGDTLECYQFKDQQKAFEFYEVQFSGMDSPARFSRLNTSVDGKTKCTSCHGQDPRPNWEIYPDWPGAYGSHDDVLTGQRK